MTRSLAIILLALTACNNKDIVTTQPVKRPQMQVISLDNRESTLRQAQHLDLDGDGVRDISVAAILIGDPVLHRDIRRFYITTSAGRFTAVDDAGNGPVLEKGAVIPGNASSFQWHEVIAPLLCEKITGDDGVSWWNGPWKTASGKYFPFYLLKNGERYYGWLKLSVNLVHESIVLHEAAISKEAGQSIVTE